jgi:hypothetical protein
VKQILNLAEKAEFIELEKLNPFQPDSLKSMTKESFEKLKESILLNNFVTSFYVWDDGESLWIIDGHHRKYALEDLKSSGVIIPDKFLCVFLRFQDEKQAAQALLTYASNHAKLHPEGFMEYCAEYNLNLKMLEQTLEIPGINIEKLDSDMLSQEPEETKESDSKLIKCPNCNKEFIA